MNNIDNQIRKSAIKVCKENGCNDSSEMMISLIEKFSAEEIDNVEVDLIIQNLIKQLS